MYTFLNHQQEWISTKVIFYNKRYNFPFFFGFVFLAGRTVQLGYIDVRRKVKIVDLHECAEEWKRSIRSFLDRVTMVKLNKL